MNEKMIEIAEDNGWRVDSIEYGTRYELRQYSPLGEDFSFAVSADNFVHDVCGYYLSFDVDEHAMMYIEAKRNDATIPPVLDLALDAYEIEKMLKNLSIALSRALRAEKESTT